MLFDRDYRVLTEQEQADWDKVETWFSKKREKLIISPVDLQKYYADLPLAALHYKQLFPNNYLHAKELDNSDKLNNAKLNLLTLLDSYNCSERNVLNFINQEKYYFIIASILNSQSFYFGHHSAFLFKEFPLPPSYQADYLIVGKNSGGYEFVFVELESPSGQITTQEGNFGTTIRKGIVQIENWDSWIDTNFSHLKLVFDKHLGKIEPLPNEFFELDKSRIHYVVIAGRRSDFSKKTYQLKRKLKKNSNILLLHYDNLLDGIDELAFRESVGSVTRTVSSGSTHPNNSPI